MFDAFFIKKLQARAREYFAAHPDIRVVVVAGSIGKATTRRALASVLSKSYRVRMHENHRKSPDYIAAEVLGITLSEKPSLFEWLGALKAAKLRVRSEKDVDIIIQEINTTQPGDFAKVATYLQPSLAVLTGITPEQMEVFGSFEAVANEYMSIGAFSNYLLINRDDIDSQLAQLETNPNFSTYGSGGAAEYRFEIDGIDAMTGYEGRFVGIEREPIKAHVGVIGEHMLRAVVAAYAAAVRIGMTDDQILSGVEPLRPLPGRMNPLNGLGDTVVIDDSHDARPASVAAALQTLYSLDTDAVPQRIAVLGDVQQLGQLAKEQHEKLGAMCDPSLVTWYVLVGKDMEMYLAPVAKGRGCQVHIARNAIEAAEFVRSVTEAGAVILVTGSGSLYLEEAVKNLTDISAHHELVRQSADVLAKKNAFFSLFK